MAESLTALADRLEDWGAMRAPLWTTENVRLLKEVVSTLRASAAPGGGVEDARRLITQLLAQPVGDPRNAEIMISFEHTLPYGFVAWANKYRNASLRPSPAPAETERDGDALSAEQVNAADVRWGVNVLLETIANKFEDWVTYDIWRSDAASTVRSYKHDAAILPEHEVDNWRDDPSADERWQAGCDFAMVQLCAVVGVDPKSVNWDAATETLDGDVSAVIGNILRAKLGDDFDFFSPKHINAIRAVAKHRD
jgi:hypothetical protein